MEYLPATGLDVYLDLWGVNWVGVDGWETRAAKGPGERLYTPVGLVNHHTAGTDWYPVNRLLKKCNLYIDPAGLVHLVSLGYQYDTGYGDRLMLEAAQNGQQPPSRPTDTYVRGIPGGPNPGVLMNSFFIDIEVGHWGLGQPIPAVQRASLILVNAAVMDMYSWDPAVHLYAHRTITRRKIDFNWLWGGKLDTIEDVRLDTADLLLGRDMRILYPRMDEPVPESNPRYDDARFRIEAYQIQCVEILNGARYDGSVSTGTLLSRYSLTPGVYDVEFVDVLVGFGMSGGGIGPREAATLNTLHAELFTPVLPGLPTFETVEVLKAPISDG